MTEPLQLPDADQVEREASEWIARLSADDVSASDRAHFREWLTAHAFHARSYEALAETYRRFAAAGLLVQAVAFGESMNKAAQGRSPFLRFLCLLLRRIRHDP